MSESRSSRRTSPVSLSGYGVAIGSSLIAMAVTWFLFPILGPISSTVFYVVVILGAWRGGLGPAILSMALSVLVHLLLFLPPLGSPGLAVDEILSVLIFLSVSAVIVVISCTRQVLHVRDQSLAALRLSEARIKAMTDSIAEQQVDRIKTEFVSLVSHELRTPLTSIKGFTDLILGGDAGPVSKEMREYLEIVQSNADQLVALVNDLLDISRIESGRIELEIEPLDLGEIVKEVVDVMRPRIEEKQQRLSVELAPEARWVRGDYDKMVQALTHYVSNAHKYTPAGGSIRVRAAQEKTFCRLAVTDTGIGIAPGDQEKLFTRFYRVDSSLTAEVGGTGLGLAIVKSIAELQGGWVGVESQPGEGSTFYLTVPLAEEHPAPGAAARVSDESRPMVAQVVVDQGRQRVLVIEDDPDTVELLSVTLQKRGFTVSLARDGATGLAMAWEQQPGLILLDLCLPGMDGFAVLQALKQDAATAEIPVIAMTASEGLTAGTRAKVLSLGASDFLTKPFDPDMLMQEILMFVQEKE